MSRLKYQVGSRVNIEGIDAPFTITQVQPALELPYLLNNDVWYDETLLSTYVEPDPTWEEVEAHVKHIIGELRAKFASHNESGLYFNITATGRPDGDIKVKYSIGDGEYDSNKVSGYSLRPTLEEMFRRKAWKERNEPLALTHKEDVS